MTIKESMESIDYSKDEGHFWFTGSELMMHPPGYLEYMGKCIIDGYQNVGKVAKVTWEQEPDRDVIHVRWMANEKVPEVLFDILHTPDLDKWSVIRKETALLGAWQIFVDDAGSKLRATQIAVAMTEQEKRK